MNYGRVIIEKRGRGKKSRWLNFSHPLEVVETHSVEEVCGKLLSVEKAVARGLTAAGFISYEAAPAFDSAFRVRPSSSLPLLWFGLYRQFEEWEPPLKPDHESFRLSPWKPSISREQYGRSIDRIKRYIAAGDTYQVNYTFRLYSKFRGDPFPFWLKLSRAQSRGCAAYVDTGRFVICSASPELFFSLRDKELFSRPMKGTAPRGKTLSEDNEKMEWLKKSKKNQAENIMIVDMIRNDMGRIAETGSVRVKNLFEIERYPTVLQMTSTVKSRTSAPFSKILEALFPCASITGAPKVRTMEIIAELEENPRGIYTGAIGFLQPERAAQFSVAIRTVLIDRNEGKAEYRVGGGITWDSKINDEYQECRIKSRVLTEERPEFKLLESLLWQKETGYFLLERHLNRIKDSGEYFGYPVDLDRIRRRLTKMAPLFKGQSHKVRLRVSRNGEILLDFQPLDQKKNKKIWIVSLAPAPVDSQNIFLYHKTTRREIHENARASRPECDEVLLWNRRGEITESTIANVVVKIGGEYFTPPVKCGLLPGTFRASLLDKGVIRERIITKEKLRGVETIYLINSVRKWVKTELTE